MWKKDSSSFRVRDTSFPSHPIGHTQLQGKLENVVWLCASRTGRCGLWCVLLNQPIITLSSLYVLWPCCPTVSLKALLFLHRAFAWTSCGQRDGTLSWPSYHFFSAFSPCVISPGETSLTIPPDTLPLTRLFFVICIYRNVFISFTPLISIKKKCPHVCHSFHKFYLPRRPQVPKHRWGNACFAHIEFLVPTSIPVATQLFVK